MTTSVDPTTAPADAPRQVSERDARRVAEAARETEWTAPSFAKELYLGRFQLDLVHPYPGGDPVEEERAEDFLARLRRVCEEEIDATVIEREDRIPDEQVKALADLGVFGMKIPEEYGGLGLSQVAYNRALLLIGSAHPSLGALVSAHQSIGVPEPLKRFGTQEQKAAFLPRCARGAISAFLLTEPDVGSDPAPCARRRRRSTAEPRTSWRASSSGPPTASWPSCSSSWPGCRRRTVTGEASPPSWSRPTPPGSASRTATSSWGCAASRTV